MISFAFYGLLALVFFELASLALGTGALAYLCYRMTKILNKMKEIPNVSNLER